MQGPASSNSAVDTWLTAHRGYIFLTPVFYYVIQWVKDSRGEPLTVVAAEEDGLAPDFVDIYDDPAHTPDFDSLRESFQRGNVVIRVEPKREHHSP